VNRLVPIGRAVLVAEFVVAVSLIVAAGMHDVPIVFVGAPQGLPVRYRAACSGIDGGQCVATLSEISRGRYRVATDLPAASLTVSITPDATSLRARQLLASAAQPTRVHTQTEAGRHGSAIDETDDAVTSERAVIPVDVENGLDSIVFTPEPGRPPAPIVVTELGLFDDARGLASDSRPLFNAIPPKRYHATLVPRAVTKLCFFTMAAAFFVPREWLRRLAPVTLAVICCSLCLLDLAVLYSPYSGHDLRSYYASGPLQEGPGSNLNGAIYEASRLLTGRGFTVADGLVSWAKMPGYGLFAAIAGLLLGHETLLQLAINTVLLQVLVYAVAVGVFAWAALKLWPPAVVWAVSLLVAMLPKQLGYTQVDSVIAPIALLLLAVVCLRLRTCDDGRAVPLRLDASLHLMFAVWFIMRPDILPAWMVVAVILHWRQPRRLLLPATLAAAIGIGWATYKKPYTGEFVPTTSTTGASLVCGLWEVPSRFPWVCSDESYFAWVTSHTRFEAKSAAAGNVVVREVLKFWVTYPGHFLFMVYNKVLRCFSGDLWPGIPTDLQQSIFQVVGRGTLILIFITAIVLTTVVGYQRERTLLLAFPVLLNAPVFWIMQTSEGRYYGGVGVALLIAAVPLLFDIEFYRRLVTRRGATLAVLASAAILAIGAWPLHDWLLRNDSFHYWTPLLDPSRSSWGILR